MIAQMMLKKYYIAESKGTGRGVYRPTEAELIKQIVATITPKGEQ